MSVNRISLVISPEQRQAAAAGVAQISSSLPGLVSVDPSEIRELHHFVGKNETFCRGMYRVLEAHPQIVPSLMAASVEKGAPRVEKGSPRSEKGSARSEKGSARSEKGSARGERGSARGERGSARGERGSARGEKGSPGEGP